MLPSVQHTRVRVDTHSVEFKDVEQLFRKTMNDQAVIKTIERVQNPFMWEKYCRSDNNVCKNNYLEGNMHDKNIEKFNRPNDRSVA